MCVPPIKQTASCSANLRHWPYDVHTCSLVIGSWMHSGEELNLSIPETPVSTLKYLIIIVLSCHTVEDQI